ncbi:MAG TPA: hypothetical protein VMU35_07625 [Methylomirabilota bacterium]|nr:hypothetical protein [Methylomirabilota bacterium]
MEFPARQTLFALIIILVSIGSFQTVASLSTNVTTTTAQRTWSYPAGPGGVRVVSSVLPMSQLPTASSLKLLCNLSPMNVTPTGIYTGSGGDAFVEDWSTGNLV